MVLTEENVISSLDLRSGDICEPSFSQISKSKMQFLNTFLSLIAVDFFVMQSGDMSLTRMTPWISLVYHLENVSHFLGVHSIMFLPLMDSLFAWHPVLLIYAPNNLFFCT